MVFKIITSEYVFKKVIKSSEPAQSTNVAQFVSHLQSVLVHCLVGEDKSHARVVEYLNRLYSIAVFDGKAFKLNISTDDNFEDNEETSGWDDGVAVEHAPAHGIQFQITDLHGQSIAFCNVIRGNVDSSVRSELVEETVDGKKSIVAVNLTYKLFQACISILVAASRGYQKLPPAQLGANVIKACLEKEAVPEKQHWALHGHAGLNFVAKFVWQTRTQTAEVIKGINLPPFEALCFMAIRMDEGRIASAVNKQEKKVDKNMTTLKSIFQACQLSQTEQGALLEKMKKKTKLWGTSGVGAAQAAANIFASKLKESEKSDKKQAEDGSDSITTPGLFSFFPAVNL